MQNQWLTYEETFVKMQYSKIPIHVIAKAISKSEDEIKSKAIDLGLEKEEVLLSEQLSIDLSGVETVKKKRKARRKDKKKTGEGFIVYMPEHPNANASGYIAEHRLIMEKVLGRYLNSNEYIYRHDGDKYNNSPDNLYIKIHNRIKDVETDVLNLMHKPIKKIQEELNISLGSIYAILKNAGYTTNEKHNPYKNKKREKGNRSLSKFQHKAYIYFKNRGYEKDYIMRVLKISEGRYDVLRKVNSSYIVYKKETKISNLSIFTFQRLKRKRGISYKKTALYYKLGGTQRKILFNNHLVEYNADNVKKE